MAGTGDTAGIGEEAGTGEVAGVTYVDRNSTLQVTRGQLKNQHLSKAPPLHQRKSAQFLPCSSDRQRNAIYIEDS